MSRHRIIRFGLIAFLVMAVLFTATILVVRSHAFHEYLLATVVEHAQQATGGRVELGDDAFRWWGLRADFYRVAVHGAEPDPHAPLFWADHLAADLTLGSIWRRQIDLKKIVRAGRVIHLLVDKQGHTNIPQTCRLRQEPGLSISSIWQLGTLSSMTAKFIITIAKYLWSPSSRSSGASFI
jgi:uncharacterized protein involved in outer membrane biogenesis